MADPETKAIYVEAAKAKGKPVFSPSTSLPSTSLPSLRLGTGGTGGTGRTGLTVADFPSASLRTSFNAPSVDEVDLSGYTGAVGDEIVIRASDIAG